MVGICQELGAVIVSSSIQPSPVESQLQVNPLTRRAPGTLNSIFKQAQLKEQKDAGEEE
jgi:hypothetical protein